MGRYRPIIGVVGLSVLITMVFPTPICNPGGTETGHRTRPSPLRHSPKAHFHAAHLKRIMIDSYLIHISSQCWAHIPIQNPTFLSHLLTLISLNHQLSVPREAPRLPQRPLSPIFNITLSSPSVNHNSSLVKNFRGIYEEPGWQLAESRPRCRNKFAQQA